MIAHLAASLAVLMLAPMAAAGAAALLDEGERRSQSAGGALAEVLVGRWTTEARHLHVDGTELVERGAVSCRWLLEQEYVLCERSHLGAGAPRRSAQLYDVDERGEVEELLTLRSGHRERVTQRAVASDVAGDRVLAGSVLLDHRGRAEIRGRFTVVDRDRLTFRNEIRTADGSWRVDYEERYERSRR